MKKRLGSILFALLLVLGMAIPAFATETAAAAVDDGFTKDVYERVQDMADLLTNEERDALTERLNEISERQQMDVAVATTNSLNGNTVQEYADGLFNMCNFGYGDNRDGLLLVISMEDNDWYIATHGAAITDFTDAGIQMIGEHIVPYLSDGNFAGAFDEYATLCDEFITQANTAAPYDSDIPYDDYSDAPMSTLWIPVAIIIGFIIALLIVFVGMRGQLKSVRPRGEANSYVKKDSLHITEQRDLFLYRTVTQTARPKNEDDGSSTHTSSDGDTFGGGGGKF